jgi:hypothetical protein
MAGRWNDNSFNAPTDSANSRAGGSSANQSPRKVLSVAQLSFTNHGIDGTSASPNTYAPQAARFEPVQTIEPDVERVAKHIQSIWATCEYAQRNTVRNSFLIVITFNNNLNYVPEKLSFS